VSLTLSNGTGYSIGTLAAVTGTITNDDVPSVTLSLAPSSVSENGAANLVYSFTRTEALTTPTTVNFSVSGTASNGIDYTGLAAGSSQAAIIPANATSVTVTIDPTADTSFEPDETVILTLNTGTGYSIGATSTVTGTITNYNNPPTLSSIMDQSINEDMPLTVPFQLTDADSSLTCSSVTATTQNTLIQKITFKANPVTNSQDNCVAEILPAPNAFGQASVTFTISDGTSTESRVFLIEVKAVNDAPLLSEISQFQTLNMNTSLFIPFTLNDVDNTLSCSSSNLQFTSSNTSLISQLNSIEWRGTWPNCLAVMTPAKNATGDSDLTLIASDGLATHARSFTISVIKPSSSQNSIDTKSQSEVTLMLGQSILLPTAADGNSNSSTCADAFLTKVDAPNILPISNISFQGTFPQCLLKISSTDAREGDVNLTLGIQNSSGGIESRLYSIKIKNIDAVIEVSTKETQAPVWINFNAAQSKTAAQAEIVSWEWDFGDGTSGKSMHFDKSYTIPGNYNVKLTVKDAAGNTGTEYILVSIKD
jgi:hypothetical protein